MATFNYDNGNFSGSLDETDLKLDKNGWASEITATLQFLMDG